MNQKQKIILITGTTDGIGRQAAKNFAMKGCKLVVHGRDKERLNETRSELMKINKNSIALSFVSDFEDLNSVVKFAETVKKEIGEIDVLLNNAGIFSHERKLTNDGFETTFQVNHLAHFLLSFLMKDNIKSENVSKIINVSSMIHGSSIDFENLNGEKSYSGNSAYALTKLCNILHANKMADLWSDKGIKVHSLHPGVIQTKLLKTAWSGGAPVEEGAKTYDYAVFSEVTSLMTGLYLENNRPMQSSPISYDKNIQDELWNISYNFVKKFL